MISTLLAISLVGSAAAGPIGRLVKGRSLGWVIALLPAGLFVGFIRFAGVIEAGQVITETRVWAPSLGLTFTLRLDGFAYLLCLVITGIGALIVIYASSYLAERSVGERARFITLILFFMTGMLGTVLADDMLVMLLFWEATSVVSFLLIGFEVTSPTARRSALMALYVTAGGGLALLASILLIGSTLGNYSLANAVASAPELARSPWIVPIVLGIIVGAFTKSAQFPFHFWLPNAMQAPTPASAYLHSATMVKLGIYLLARFETLIGEVSWGRDALVGVAIITMLVGAFQAIRSENYKTVLAYSTVTSLGVLVMLVGLDGPMASVAMVGFLVAHALYKATLFLCAGTVIHATGLTRLRLMGGLGRFLPITAVASALASLSMAGLPPFLGFVSKEFLFEAQIESSWNVFPMAVAVLANAVLVGVAGVVTLRPFFLNPGRVQEVRHREVPELLVGPVVLALLGLVVSLDPDWIGRVLLGPAVTAVYGQTIDVDVNAFHGVTPVLLLSGAVVGFGSLLFVYWVPLHQRLRAETWLDRHDVEEGYEALLRFSAAIATRIASRIQRTELREHLRIILAAALAFVIWGLATREGGLRIAGESGNIRWGPAAVALVGLAGGIAAARARSLLAAMIAAGLAGLVVALTFLMNGAPDLALTQFAVESLIVVLLTAALLTLPLSAPPTRPPRARVMDALLAGALSLIVFVVLLDMGAAAPQSEASAFFGDQSYLRAFGRNVVNVILVDFRGFDTLGETTVIAISAVIAWSLLGPWTFLTGENGRRSVFVLEFAAPLLFWLLGALSVFVLVRGHNEIGGGFVGGLTASLAFALLALTHGVARARRWLGLHPMALAGGGLLLAVSSGLPGLLIHGDYLRHIWLEVDVLGFQFKQGTTLVFDLGVYLAVLGTVLSFLFGLSRRAES